MILKVIYIFHKISVEKKILEIFCALLSNVVGDKKLRSYLAFKGFGKENQREVEKADNATTDLQDNRIYIFLLICNCFVRN